MHRLLNYSTIETNGATRLCNCAFCAVAFIGGIAASDREANITREHTKREKVFDCFVCLLISACPLHACLISRATHRIRCLAFGQFCSISPLYSSDPIVETRFERNTALISFSRLARKQLVRIFAPVSRSTFKNRYNGRFLRVKSRSSKKDRIFKFVRKFERAISLAIA